MVTAMAPCLASIIGARRSAYSAVTSFCQYDHRSGKAVANWFARDDDRPLFFLPESGALGKVFAPARPTW
jgi:hypothetical protein